MYPDRTEVKKLEIMEKDQGYKKKLTIRRKNKCIKFMEREKKLKLREETELYNSIEKSVNDKIYTPVQNKNVTKRDESKDMVNLTDLIDDGENHQRLSCVTAIVSKGKRKRLMLKCCRVDMNFCSQFHNLEYLCSNEQCNQRDIERW